MCVGGLQVPSAQSASARAEGLFGISRQNTAHGHITIMAKSSPSPSSAHAQRHMTQYAHMCSPGGWLASAFLHLLSCVPWNAGRISRCRWRSLHGSPEQGTSFWWHTDDHTVVRGTEERQKCLAAGSGPPRPASCIPRVLPRPLTRVTAAGQPALVDSRPH